MSAIGQPYLRIREIKDAAMELFKAPMDYSVQLAAVRACGRAEGMVPVADIVAEAAVLSHWLRGGALRGAAAEDFHDELYRSVARAVVAIDARAGSVDAVTVHAEMKAQGVEFGRGRDAYERLQGIVDFETVGNYEEHLAIIVDSAKKRRIVANVQTWLVSGYKPSTDTTEWLRQASEIVANETSAGDKGPRFVVVENVFEPLEEPDYVIDGVFRRGSLALLAAYGSSSKTWQALDACVSVLCGDKWLGRFEAKRGRAAFIDWESGTYELRRRVQLLTKARGWSKLDGLSLVTMPPYMLGTPEFAKACDVLAAEHQFIAIDSLRAGSTCDENDSRIRLGLDQLRVIAERRNCTFVVLVHAKKTSGSITAIDERETLRGSSAIYDAADAVFVSIYDQNEERFEVTQAKARHGRKVDPFRLRLVDVPDGVVMVTEDVPPAETKPSRAEQASANFDEACERVRRTLRDNPGIGTRVLEAKAGGNKGMTAAALEHLISVGEVVDLATKHGNRTDHHYRIAGVTQ